MIEIKIKITTENGNLRCQGSLDKDSSATGREKIAADEIYEILKQKAQNICHRADHTFDFFGKSNEDDPLDERSLDAPIR